MIESLIKKLLGDPDIKKVKAYTKLVEEVNEFEKQMEHFTQEDIFAKTASLRARFDGLDFKNPEDSLKIKNILSEIKTEAFAVVKQACKLLYGKSFDLPSGKQVTWNMIPYDVQLIGGFAIHDGNISEMKTWEWKTLVATLPAYLNALTGNPVHIVTVNDYLARRDGEEMGILYNALGLKVGVVTHHQSKEAKKEAYACDIVYATNNELGFDYLRDNMAISKDHKAQSSLFFAIVDEVDSILVDEARTPLIISTPDNEPTSKYLKFAELIKYLEEDLHYKIDEKQKWATLTDAWVEKVEELLKIDNIYISAHYNDLHHVENALKAKAVFKKDRDYIIAQDEVLIVDEHTGRVLSGRRYSDGLHQALEAKEKVTIKQESKTLASITFQNYFRMYWKLAGMTGTAKTEEEEFYKVYGLETIVIPTNKPIIRDDRPDILFKNEKGKFTYVVKMIQELYEKGQPVLVWTVSVEKSEYLSQRLREAGIPHNVLNAKYHEKEAEIVANAGQIKAITIATNMAWRGTDIKLAEGVKELGGLYIIGTEKHETRRIDNQLRGRAGRQGDPGVTQFLVSPNDDIMRIFGGDKLFGVFNSSMFASLPDEEPLTESRMLTNKVTSVQKQVEGHHFDTRKHVLEYDDVMNKHREIIYSRRNKILESQNIDEDIHEMIQTQVRKFVEAEIERMGEYLDKKELIRLVNEFLGHPIIDDTLEQDDIFALQKSPEISKYIAQIAIEELHKIKSVFKSEEAFFEFERRIVLQSIDELWMKHIDSMSNLRQEVAFEGYAQKNPLVVYKEKAFVKFQDLIDEIEYKTTKAIYSIKNSTVVIETVAPDESQMQNNEAQIESTLSSGPEIEDLPDPRKNNPLFMPPQQSQGNRNKIRV